jgi:hypothetical protein
VVTCQRRALNPPRTARCEGEVEDEERSTGEEKDYQEGGLEEGIDEVNEMEKKGGELWSGD